MIGTDRFDDGWMNCSFAACSTVFQLYQNAARMIMKGGVQWNLIYSWKDFCL